MKLEGTYEKEKKCRISSTIANQHPVKFPEEADKNSQKAMLFLG